MRAQVRVSMRRISVGHRSRWGLERAPSIGIHPQGTRPHHSCALTEQAAGVLYHIVQEGETLAHIAARYGISVRQLKESNFKHLYQRAAEQGAVPPGHHHLVKSELIHSGNSVTADRPSTPKSRAQEEQVMGIQEPIPLEHTSAAFSTNSQNAPLLASGMAALALLAGAAALFKAMTQAPIMRQSEELYKSHSGARMRPSVAGTAHVLSTPAVGLATVTHAVDTAAIQAAPPAAGATVPRLPAKPSLPAASVVKPGGATIGALAAAASGPLSARVNIPACPAPTAQMVAAVPTAQVAAAAAVASATPPAPAAIASPSGEFSSGAGRGQMAEAWPTVTAGVPAAAGQQQAALDQLHGVLNLAQEEPVVPGAVHRATQIAQAALAASATGGSAAPTAATSSAIGSTSAANTPHGFGSGAARASSNLLTSMADATNNMLAAVSHGADTTINKAAATEESAVSGIPITVSDVADSATTSTVDKGAGRSSSTALDRTTSTSSTANGSTCATDTLSKAASHAINTESSAAYIGSSYDARSGSSMKTANAATATTALSRTGSLGAGSPWGSAPCTPGLHIAVLPTLAPSPTTALPSPKSSPDIIASLPPSPAAVLPSPPPSPDVGLASPLPSPTAAPSSPTPTPDIPLPSQAPSPAAALPGSGQTSASFPSLQLSQPHILDGSSPSAPSVLALPQPVLAAAAAIAPLPVLPSPASPLTPSTPCPPPTPGLTAIVLAAAATAGVRVQASIPHHVHASTCLDTGTRTQAAPANGPKKSLVTLKCELLDAVYGTSRGLDAGQEQRAAVEELLTVLEGRRPSGAVGDASEEVQAAAEAAKLLSGRWKLVYTSHTQTLMLLNAIRSIPLVDLGDVYQTIDPVGLTAQNKIDVASPKLVTLHADASYKVHSGCQVKVRFTRVGMDTYIQVPQILSQLEFPATIDVLGSSIDLSPLRRLTEPFKTGLGSAHSLVSALLAPQLPVDAGEGSSLWMLTTYLDEGLHVSRDDMGRVFVMLKDVP